MLLPDIHGIGRFKPCGGKRTSCHLCRSTKNACIRKSKHSDEVYKINKDFNDYSKMPIYLIEYQVYCEQCTFNTKTKFLSRANNYKTAHRKFINKK